MNISVEEFLINFIRNYTETFSAKELHGMLNGFGYKIPLSEVKELLESDPCVFPLEKNLYITRAGAFSERIFSFVPTRQEIAQRVFVPGDRCMPFVDGEIISSALKFSFLGRNLPTKIFTTDCNTACSLFTFYGDEYVPQYIAADPVNEELHLAENNFELPQKINLTGISMDYFFELGDFQYGDRILLRVSDWNKGELEIAPLFRMKENPFKMDDDDIDREKWFSLLEKYLLESFDRLGPCRSMEEQFANVFYEHRRELCTPNCGSIKEFLDKSKKIGMELFGVETRLWRKGEDVPAVGNWNRHCYGLGSSGILPLFSMPDYIIDCFIKDQLHEKKNDEAEILNRIVPKEMKLSKDEKNFLSLQITNRNAIIREKYNWFADFSYGAIRHRALELYSKIGNLVFELDCDNDEVTLLPQQELVTLSQLFTHISRMLELFSSDIDCDDEETFAMNLSLDGMEFNFEEIRLPLLDALEKIHRNRFAVI